MSWTRPADVRAAVQKAWDQGVLLKELAEASSVFPMPVRLKCPSSRELVERYPEVRAWIDELCAIRHCRVELREVKHRVLGANRVPHALWVDSVDDALSMVGRSREAKVFCAMMARTRVRQPRLLPWLMRRPLRALEFASEWDRLLDIVSWLQSNPRPDVYLRQVDIPGVHTKFIEVHRAVLTELLDCVLPSAAIDERAVGLGAFARRYGFREKPHGIRLRILDPRHALFPAPHVQDVTLDEETFAQLACAVRRVMITENEINFLAFPRMPDTMVVFGAGYGFDALRQARWLSRCQIHYWGDIDTHGFAILDQLRRSFHHVASFLMDARTFLAFKAQWTVEEKPTRADLSRLTAEESTLYDDLRDNRLGKHLRLEQERVGYEWLVAALNTLA